jgi:hypothetical protein
MTTSDSSPLHQNASGLAGLPALAAPPMVEPTSHGRLTVTHLLPAIAFPMIGCLLYIVGDMPVPDVFTFLLGCGAIGAAVTIFVTGGRRAAVAIAHGILAAMNPK